MVVLGAMTSAVRLPIARVVGALALSSVLFFSLLYIAVAMASTKSMRLGDSWMDGTKASWLSSIPSVKQSTKGSEYEDWSLIGGNGSAALVNATFVILARNTDVWEILASIRGMEDRFNKKYHYPYVFLNDVPFSEEFKLHTSSIASGKCTYGVIDKSEWEDWPEWIDKEKATKSMEAMAAANVIYGGSLSYRRMCRYQSGFFWRHPLLDEYKYYWRIEPSVKYFCDIDYDPFKVMRDGKKKYGFVVSLYEYAETIPTLWDTTKGVQQYPCLSIKRGQSSRSDVHVADCLLETEFIETHPEYLAQPNLMEWVSNDNGDTYNRCHYWSNFEVGDLDFWRSEAYVKYFEYLDRAGGFFYERWGDAPVHSIAASLFLKPEEVHFFDDIGYRHEPFQHCPQNKAASCACNPNDENNFETHWYSCTPAYKKITKWKPSRPSS